jgi:hypothetical protein
MTNIRVEHKLGLQGAVERFGQVAQRHGMVLHSSDGGHSGSIEKKVPFVGAVQGRFAVSETAIDITVDSAPAFLGPDTIRRMVSDELSKALA